MLTDLRAIIEKLVEFDEGNLPNYRSPISGYLDRPPTTDFIHGARYQHQQNEKVRRALLCAVEHKEQRQWLEFHACITGDCPHLNHHECFDEIVKVIQEQSAEDKKALEHIKKILEGE